MKRIWISRGASKIFLTIIIFLVVNILITSTAIASIKDLTWSSGGFGGKPYMYSAAVATYINRESDIGEKYRLSIQAAHGTIDNVRRLQRQEIDFGCTDSHIYFWHTIPEIEWDEVYDNVRMICRVYSGGFPFVTLEGSGIETYKDLVGKTISLGPAGTGNHIVASMALDALGIADKIKKLHHPWGEIGDALADGHVDAVLSSTLPTGYLEELSARRKITWVGLSPEEESIIKKKLPYIPIQTIKPGMHGVQKSVRALGISNWWVTHKDVSDEVVDTIMRAFFTEEGIKQAGNVTDIWQQWTYEDALVGLPGPLHPAAEAFWKEKGLKIPEVNQ